MKKVNQKCVRLTDETLDYINTFPGEGFNRKLENMVELIGKREKNIKNNIKVLEKKRDTILRDIEELCKIKNKLQSIERCIEQAHKLVSY